jgi:heat shock protein HtpX
MFPLVFFLLTWLFFFFLSFKMEDFSVEYVNRQFLYTIPWIIIGVMIWFTIAWLSHSSMIRSATDSRPLSRIENKRVYNLVENLCISAGMTMPAINVIEDDSLNAFASGID